MGDERLLWRSVLIFAREQGGHYGLLDAVFAGTRHEHVVDSIVDCVQVGRARQDMTRVEVGLDCLLGRDQKC